MKKFCSKCGAELEDTAGFCPKCGAPTGFHHEDNNRKEAHGHQGTNKKSLYALLIVLGAIILIIVGAIAFSGYFEKREARIAREKFVADSIMQAKKDSLKLIAQARQDSINREIEVQEKLKYLGDFYKNFWHYEAESERYRYEDQMDKSNEARENWTRLVKQNVTSHGLSVFRNLYEYDDCSDCYAFYMLGWDGGPDYDFQPYVTINVAKEDDEMFLVEIRYKSRSKNFHTDDSFYKIGLKVVNVNGKYLIDDILTQDSSIKSYTKNSKSTKIVGEIVRCEL